MGAFPGTVKSDSTTAGPDKSIIGQVLWAGIHFTGDNRDLGLPTAKSYMVVS
jgi:hypothetical protein